MDYTFIVKNSFLKHTIGSFTDELGNADIKKVENVMRANLSWYVPKSIVKDNKKIIQSVFDNIDGRTLNKEELKQKKATIPLVREDNIIEKAEIYQLVKDYYACVHNVSLKDEDISKMKISKLLDIIAEMVKFLSKQNNKK